MKKHLNVHPGELLREEFLEPMGITPYRLAKDAKLPQQRVNEIVNEKRGITADTDLHLCVYFGQTPGYWLRVQLAYDLREAINTIGPKIKGTIHPLQAA
jgi:addiction module HigA family antidote